MTFKEFDIWYQKLEDEAVKLLSKKGFDYCGETTDQFANFKRMAQANPRWRALDMCHVLLHKHLDAIDTFVTTGKLESESLRSRILDARNFLALLGAMVEGNVEKNAVPSTSNNFLLPLKNTNCCWACHEGACPNGTICPECGFDYSKEKSTGKWYSFTCDRCKRGMCIDRSTMELKGGNFVCPWCNYLTWIPQMEEEVKPKAEPKKYVCESIWCPVCSETGEGSYRVDINKNCPNCGYLFAVMAPKTDDIVGSGDPVATMQAQRLSEADKIAPKVWYCSGCGWGSGLSQEYCSRCSKQRVVASWTCTCGETKHVDGHLYCGSCGGYCRKVDSTVWNCCCGNRSIQNMYDKCPKCGIMRKYNERGS